MLGSVLGLIADRMHVTNNLQGLLSALLWAVLSCWGRQREGRQPVVTQRQVLLARHNRSPRAREVKDWASMLEVSQGPMLREEKREDGLRIEGRETRVLTRGRIIIVQAAHQKEVVRTAWDT